jgi:hypothetical protein
MHSRCSGTNRDGGPCNAEVRPERAWCRWHDPELEADRAVWRRKGGEARSNKARAKKALPDAVLSPAELQGVLSQAIRDVLTGTLEPGPANAAAALSRALVTIREATELEERLAALEDAAGIDRRLA